MPTFQDANSKYYKQIKQVLGLWQRKIVDLTSTGETESIGTQLRPVEVL